MNTEHNRLNAVSRFKKLNKEISSDLNDIINLTAQICNTPIALITLLDEDTQWFKAVKGLDFECTDRSLSFCNHTIEQDSLMMVPDTRLDKRFIDNPLVTGEPFIRFYAGATLTTKDGYAIGSLCVADFESRELDELQQNSLKVLSRQVMNLMELNWSMHILEQQHGQTQDQKKFIEESELKIEESELKLNAVFNSSKDTHILVNKNLEVLAFNKAAAAFVRQSYRKKLKTGVPIIKFIDQEVTPGLTQHLATAFTGKIMKFDWHMRPGTKYACWKEVEFIPIKNGNKEIIGVALNSTDITDRKLQEDQINIQNAALTRIAIIQSHELRRPVASLLGIMALIKLEQDKGGLEYFNIMELTIKELDEKICEIVKDSENIINNHLAIVA